MQPVEGGTTGAIRKNLGVEHPAKPPGWYSYSFRFTLQASAEVALSTERLEQGGVAALSHHWPDRRDRSRCGDRPGQRSVRPAGRRLARLHSAAYNASAGGHTVNVTVNGETLPGR